MNTAIKRTSGHLSVIEHLTALHDTRDMVLSDAKQLAELDAEIEKYARECPDAFGAYVKFCKGKQEAIKQECKNLTDSYSRKESVWCARESAAREVALKTVRTFGELRGDVFSITKQQNQRLDIYDEPLIPAEFWTVIPERRIVDRDRVEKALRANVNVPGAQLVDGTEFVVIR